MIGVPGENVQSYLRVILSLAAFLKITWERLSNG